MKSIIYLEQEDFLQQMVKDFFSSKGVDVIIPDAHVNVSELIKESCPDIVVVDYESMTYFNLDLNQFFGDLEKNNYFSTGKIVITKKNDNNISNVNSHVYLINKPLGPNTFYSQLIEIIKS